jgi:hypothetical protein
MLPDPAIQQDEALHTAYRLAVNRGAAFVCYAARLQPCSPAAFLEGLPLLDKVAFPFCSSIYVWECSLLL